MKALARSYPFLCLPRQRCKLSYLLVRQGSTLASSASRKSSTKAPPPDRPNAELLLKYDPIREQNPKGFNEFGILPFLQSKLNKYLLPKDESDTFIPKYNATPTLDQRLILSVLSSQYSVVHKGSGSATGKSLAIATYAVNFSLSRFPNFGILGRHKNAFDSVDTVVLVPTDALVEKYEKFIRVLSEDIPEDCCPDRLNEDEKSFTRRPLKVEFYSSAGQSKVLTTASSAQNQQEERCPHILVTTPTGLYDIMNKDPAEVSSVTRKDNLSEVRFFAVDDLEFMINCTSVGNNENFTTYGKKNKYVSKLKKIVDDLQDLQVSKYSLNLSARLKSIEKKYKERSDKLEYSRFVFQNNSLSTADFNAASSTETLFNSEVLEWRGQNKVDTSLLKRLIKAKRQVFYKPIQFCFTMEAKSPLSQVLRKMNNQEQVGAMLDNISDQVSQIESTSNKDTSKLQKNYLAYLNERGEKIYKEQSKDPQVEFVEKLIRFNDSKRLFRNQERKILSVGAFSVVKNEDDPVHVSFITPEFKSANTFGIRDIDTESNYPNTNTEIVQKFADDITYCSGNIKNFQKLYLKGRQAKPGLNYPKQRQVLVSNITSTIQKFRAENPLNFNPFIIVIPGYFKEHLKSLSSSIDIENHEFKFLDDLEPSEIQSFISTQQPKKDTEVIQNLVVTPADLISHDVSDCFNMAVFGIDCLFPQLATANGSDDASRTSQLKFISGIEDPLQDLFFFYYSRISNSPSVCEKHLIFNTLGCKPLDFNRVGDMVIYNNLREHVDIQRLCDSKKPEVLRYGLNRELADSNRGPKPIPKYKRKMATPRPNRMKRKMVFVYPIKMS